MNELDYWANVIEFSGPCQYLHHIKYKLQSHYPETSLSGIHHPSHEKSFQVSSRVGQCFFNAESGIYHLIGPSPLLFESHLLNTDMTEHGQSDFILSR